MYSLWIENMQRVDEVGKGETWNLITRDIYNDINASLLTEPNKFIGFDNDITTSVISDDWVVNNIKPKQVSVSGKMYFRDSEHIKLFSQFVGSYNNRLRLYYDPDGLILPTTQVAKTWYREVVIRTLSRGMLDTKTGLFILDINMTVLSSMWRRDNILASTIMGVVGEEHIFPHFYPYFYSSGQMLYLGINNTGEKVGCVVEITNKGTNPLPQVSYIVTNESTNTREYAKWMGGANKVESGRTLLVDSNAVTIQASINYLTNPPQDISKEQEPSPQYINFVSIRPGENEFMFDLGRINDVDITVSYTEQVRIV